MKKGWQGWKTFNGCTVIGLDKDGHMKYIEPGRIVWSGFFHKDLELAKHDLKLMQMERPYSCPYYATVWMQLGVNGEMFHKGPWEWDGQNLYHTFQIYKGESFELEIEVVFTIMGSHLGGDLIPCSRRYATNDEARLCLEQIEIQRSGGYQDYQIVTIVRSEDGLSLANFLKGVEEPWIVEHLRGGKVFDTYDSNTYSSTIGFGSAYERGCHPDTF